MKADGHVNSDRAKGPERRSTSGGMMTINGTVVSDCVLRVRQAQGHRGAKEILEARSSTMSDARPRNAKNLWQHSAMGALTARVSRIREAAAERTAGAAAAAKDDNSRGRRRA